jgi:CheY-like chemotaxis protein
MTEPRTATILVVDDEPAILKLAQLTLEEDGHEVLTATSGPAALALVDGTDKQIDLFLIDVVMPEIGGPELAEQLAKRRPGVPMIFASGYGEAAGVALKKRDPSAVYLKKPFSPAALGQLVQELLARGST